MLDTKGFLISHFPNSNLSRMVSSVMKAWYAFCSLPNEIKDQFQLTGFERDMADPGYRRKGNGDGFDDKELCHVVPFTTGLIALAGINISKMPGEVATFFHRSSTLARKLGNSLSSNAFGKLFEDEELGRLFRKEISTSRGLFTLRFLNYSKKSGGVEIATPHIDKSGLTFQLHTSHDGLQHLVDGVWHNLGIRRDQVLAFGGHQAHLLSKGKVQPMVHRVIQPSTNECRSSLIGFVPFLSIERVSKDVRMIDLMAGLGYHVP